MEITVLSTVFMFMSHFDIPDHVIPKVDLSLQVIFLPLS